MTSYILNTTTVQPLSKDKPQQAIVLCHGYGGDGKDISMLAIGWQRFLPNAIFLCPDGPERCAINPKGYQWFDLESEKESIIFEKSLVAEETLSKFLDQILDDFQLEAGIEHAEYTGEDGVTIVAAIPLSIQKSTSL